MLDSFGKRQSLLLRVLLKEKQGRTIDQLIADLHISRTAVTQHLTTLERLGLVSRGLPQETGGRPVQIYKLSPRGYDLFPKQYSWFSELMIESIKKERGSGGLSQWMAELGQSVASALGGELKCKTFAEKMAGIAKIMNDLNYEAEVVSEGQGDKPALEATNCVYHHIAQKFPEVCHFDTSFLSTMTGSPIEHEKCIIRGDDVCRFKKKVDAP